MTTCWSFSPSIRYRKIVNEVQFISISTKKAAIGTAAAKACFVRIADLIAAHSERQLCGQTGLMHTRLLLTQHFLAVAASFLLRCGLPRGSGHSNYRSRQIPNWTCAAAGRNMLDMDFRTDRCSSTRKSVRRVGFLISDREISSSRLITSFVGLSRLLGRHPHTSCTVPVLFLFPAILVLRFQPDARRSCRADGPVQSRHRLG